MNFSKIYSSGVVIAILGIVLFSAKAILVKLAYQYHVTSIHLLLFRMLFSAPIYIVIAFYVKPSNPSVINKIDYSWILFFGFIGYYLASYFDFIGLQFIKAGLERIILFVYPTLVLLISKLFLKTPITLKQAIAIVITYIGVVITFWGEVQFEGEYVLYGGFLIFLSALTYASYLVGSGWLIPKFGAIPFTAYAMIVSTVCVIFHYLIVDRTDFLVYSSEVYILGFLMAIFSTVIPSFLVSFAIKKLGASNFSIIGSVGPISTIVLAYLVLDEKFTLLQLAGMLIVIAGVVIISIKKKPL